MNSQWILTILLFIKNHLEKSHFTFVVRLRRFDRAATFLSHVCSDFNIFFWPLLLRPCIYREVRDVLPDISKFPSKIKTYCKTQVAFKMLTKHIEFPRLYSFSLFRFFFHVFPKCACSPRAVKKSYMAK